MSYTLSKSELFYKDYTGASSNNDNPNVRDGRDSSKFDKNEWYEVLSVINHISRLKGFTTRNECRLIEAVIREHLPLGYNQNREGAIQWLIENYSNWQLTDVARAA